MRPACSYTDYFVVCTGQTPARLRLSTDEVHAVEARRATPAQFGGRPERSVLVVRTTSTWCFTSSRRSHAPTTGSRALGDALPSRSRGLAGRPETNERGACVPRICSRRHAQSVP